MLALLFLLASCSNSSDLNAPKIDNPKNPMLVLYKDKAREEFKNMKEKKQQLDATNPMHMLCLENVGW